MSHQLPHFTVQGAAGSRPLRSGRAWEAYPQPGMWVRALSATDFEDLFSRHAGHVTPLVRQTQSRSRSGSALSLLSRQRQHRANACISSPARTVQTYGVALAGHPRLPSARGWGLSHPLLHFTVQGAAGSRPLHIGRAWEAYPQPGMWVHAPSATDFEDLIFGYAGHVTAFARPLPCGGSARSRTSSSTHARHWAVDP
jgi:hypothetical protein